MRYVIMVQQDMRDPEDSRETRLADPVLPTAEISVTRTATSAEILRAVGVLAKLDTFDRLFDLHRRHVRITASTVDELATGDRDAKPR